MPVNSRYSDKEFEAIMQEVLDVFEHHKANRALSLQILGNVTTQVFNGYADDKERQSMVESFCRVLEKTTRTQK